ncbi:MAG: hypothetical protein DRQ02_13535, partial [Candidatus Latescibacterota bacterium]
NLETGHITIARTEYLRKRVFLPVDELIEEPSPIIHNLLKFKEVKLVAPRIKFIALISKGNTTKPAYIMAIDPVKEKSTLDIRNRLIKGSENLESGFIIGRDLANSLKINPGDTLILFSRTTLGGLNGIKLPVSGIANFGMSKLNRSFVIMSLKHARKLLKTNEGVSEILLFLQSEKQIHQLKAKLNLPPGTDAKSYMELLGAFGIYFKLAGAFYGFIYILIIGLATFAIINTMTVAVFERLREIGTLKAIGMTDNEVFMLFGMEGTMLGALGGFFGPLLGLIFAYGLSIKGINFESILKNTAFPMPYVIRPEVNFKVFLFAFILTLIISALSSVFPALYARKLTPQEALRQV